MKVFFLALLFIPLILGNPPCRCIYGKECWPKTNDFSRLSSRLSRPLLYPKPPGLGCYPVHNPSGNCSEITRNTHNARWRSDHPGSMQDPFFESFVFPNGTINMCYLDATLGFPCSQGSIPEVGVDARSIQDVQAAIRFASKHNLRLVIKNTGHDYLGRSAGRGGFLLWMHNFKNNTYNPSFVPLGGSTEENYRALTVGAGVQWFEAYEAAESYGQMTVGATVSTVGAAGGWIMGGGHSSLTPRHGLGVDNVLQYEVVIANGTYLIVNAYKNTDLFWALRGGGGGTYAVVLSATYKTHTPVPITIITGLTNFTSLNIANRVITEFIRIQPSLTDAGWGCHSFLPRDELSYLFVVPNVTIADANALLDPFFTLTRDVAGEASGVQNTSTMFKSFYEWYSVSSNEDGLVGRNLELSSRLIPRDLAEHDPEKVAGIILGLPHSCNINFIAGGAVSRVDPETTGLHPDWRKAIGYVYSAEQWEDGASSSTIQAARKRIRSTLELLEDLGSATYFNEASLYEKNPREIFFGSHYKRLKVIKNKYDPMGLFLVASGVGSEDWDASLTCHKSSIFVGSKIF